MHDIDDNYSSEELISDNTDSGEEDNPRPIYAPTRTSRIPGSTYSSHYGAGGCLGSSPACVGVTNG